MFNLELAKFMFKYNKGLLLVNFNKYFTVIDSIHSYHTPVSKNKFFITLKNKNKGLHSLS